MTAPSATENAGMSDEAETPRGSALERVRKRVSYLAIRKATQDNLPSFKESLEQQVRDGKLSAEDAADSLSGYARMCSGPVEPTALEVNMMDFVKRIKNRQGTFTPDFDELSRKKANIDHRLAEDDPRD